MNFDTEHVKGIKIKIFQFPLKLSLSQVARDAYFTTLPTGASY